MVINGGMVRAGHTLCVRRADPQPGINCDGIECYRCSSWIECNAGTRARGKRANALVLDAATPPYPISEDKLTPPVRSCYSAVACSTRRTHVHSPASTFPLGRAISRIRALRLHACAARAEHHHALGLGAVPAAGSCRIIAREDGAAPGCASLL